MRVRLDTLATRPAHRRQGVDGFLDELPEPRACALSAAWSDSGARGARVQTGAPPPCAGLSGDPALSSAFTPRADDDTAPLPDSSGGVGPQHVATLTNAGITIQSRAGAVLLDASLEAFFGPLGATSPRQPRAAYHAGAGRWITSALEGAIGTERVLFAISDGDDPTGAWSLLAIAADPGGTSRPDWLAMGYDGTWIALTANMFNLAGTVFLGAKMWVIDLASALVPGGPITVSTFATGFPAVSGFNTASQMPTRGLDAGAGLFLVNDSIASGGVPALQGFRVTGTGAAPVVTPLPGSSFGASAGVFLVVNSFSLSLRAMPQADDPRELGAFSARVASAVARNGHVWLAHSGGLPGPAGNPAPTQTAVCWYELDPLALPVPIVQSGQVTGGPDSACVAPSLAVNCAADVLLGFSSGDASRHPEASFCLRLATDPAGSMRPVRRLRAGAASYWRDTGGATSAWGRTSATDVDPTNDRSFWTLQAYADDRAGPLDEDSRWGTVWGEIGEEAPSYLDAFSISQVDYAFANLDWSFSDTGRLQVDLGLLRATLPAGFVNVATPRGWVVQNLPVVAELPYEILETYFDIGPLAFDHEPLSSLQVWFSYGPDVLTEFDPGAFGVSPVGHEAYAAEGFGASVDEKPEPPLPGGLTFKAGLKAIQTHMADPPFTNEQAAHNQCVPMAIANGLAWLSAKYDLTLLGTHKKGLRKDTPNNSLVGILEEKMNRTVTSRELGLGVHAPQRRAGTKAYLTQATLDKVLEVDDRGIATQPKPLRDFIKAGIKNGSFVAIDLRRKATGEPDHSVALVGYGIVGKPEDSSADRLWFAIVHDSEQTNSDKQDERGTHADGKVIVTASYVNTKAGAENSFQSLPRPIRTVSAFEIKRKLEEKRKR